MEVQIEKDGNKGTIVYDEKTKSVKVTFLDAEVKESITRFLDTVREFRVPREDEEGTLDLVEFVKTKPTEDESYMILGLSNLYAVTGVWVNW